MAVRKLLDKLHKSAGETLVETLAAILIAALAVELLFTCVAGARSINEKAKKKDEGYTEGTEVHKGYYKSLSDAEEHGGTGESASVTIKKEVEAGETPPSAVVNVNLYGGDGVYSYK